MNIIKTLAYHWKYPFIYAPLLRFGEKVLTIAPYKHKESNIEVFDLAIINDTAAPCGSEASSWVNEVKRKVRKLSVEDKKEINQNHLHDLKYLIKELRRIVPAYNVIKNEELEFGALSEDNDFINLSCIDTDEFKSVLICRCCLLVELKSVIRLLEEKFNLA